jgi:hypothetical protein
MVDGVRLPSSSPRGPKGTGALGGLEPTELGWNLEGAQPGSAGPREVRGEGGLPLMTLDLEEVWRARSQDKQDWRRGLALR